MMKLAEALMERSDLKTRIEQLAARLNENAKVQEGAKLAKEQKTTRAAVSMEIAASWNKPTIFVVGNAPTALMKLYEMYQAGLYKPAFIIGVPVGFVNVVEAKEEIMETDIPYIINKGRKGGSNVAAAIMNALFYMAADDDKEWRRC